MGAETSVSLSVGLTADPSTLTTSLLGPGIQGVGTPSYIGGDGTGVTAIAAGTFADGLAAGIGIDTGIILTSGSAALAVGPNTDDRASHVNDLAGDADLDTLTGGAGFTSDATILEFDFKVPGLGPSQSADVVFNYVFASDEYNEFANLLFNDVFGFFMGGSGGTNIATLVDGVTPVSINTVNGGNPDYSLPPVNGQFFNNNDLDDGGPFHNVEYDGFTDVFSATASVVGPDVHRLKLAIADTTDDGGDSAVFIEAATVAYGPIPAPEPTNLWLALAAVGVFGLFAAFRKRMADRESEIAIG